MKKEDIEMLKEAFLQKKYEFVILFVLSTIEDAKFISSQYIYDVLELPKSNTGISWNLYRLARMGLIEKRYLVAYRMNQIAHDRYMVDNNFDLLASRGFIPLGKIKNHLKEDDYLTISDNVPSILKKHLNWVDDVEIEGRIALQEFAENSIFGPYKITGKALTQNVYRLSSQGMLCLDYYKSRLSGSRKFFNFPENYIEQIKLEFANDEESLKKIEGILMGREVAYHLWLFLEEQSKFRMDAKEIIAIFDNGQTELIKEEAEKRVRIEKLWQELHKLTT